VLAGLTAVAGVGWWMALPRANWIAAPARVVAVSLLGEGGMSPRPSLVLYYEYVVAGQVYRGQVHLDRIGRMRYGTLPPEVKEVLRSRGYGQFEDLPTDLQELMRERGFDSFDAVPVRVAEALGEAAEASGGEVPEEVKGPLRERDYTGAARAAGFSDERIAALTAASIDVEVARRPDGGAMGADTIGAGAGSAPGTAPLESGATLWVRYDPENPSYNEVLHLPYADAFFNVGVFAALTLLTLGYCGVLYPRLKTG